jgi:hypothetical protein
MSHMSTAGTPRSSSGGSSVVSRPSTPLPAEANGTFVYGSKRYSVSVRNRGTGEPINLSQDSRGHVTATAHALFQAHIAHALSQGHRQPALFRAHSFTLDNVGLRVTGNAMLLSQHEEITSTENRLLPQSFRDRTTAFGRDSTKHIHDTEISAQSMWNTLIKSIERSESLDEDEVVTLGGSDSCSEPDTLELPAPLSTPAAPEEAMSRQPSLTEAALEQHQRELSTASARISESSQDSRTEEFDIEVTDTHGPETSEERWERNMDAKLERFRLKNPKWEPQERWFTRAWHKELKDDINGATLYLSVLQHIAKGYQPQRETADRYETPDHLKGLILGIEALAKKHKKTLQAFAEEESKAIEAERPAIATAVLRSEK